MNWTMPYPWRSRSDSVRRINMSSEPGNESFFCALRPIPRILSLQRRDYASQVQIGEPSRRKTISGVLTRAGCESLWRSLPLSTTGYVRSQLAYRVRALVRVVVSLGRECFGVTYRGAAEHAGRPTLDKE